MLVILGAGTRDGFVTMVEYTAPVFWLFSLMVGTSIFILRYKKPVVSDHLVYIFILLRRFSSAVYALSCFIQSDVYRQRITYRDWSADNGNSFYDYKQNVYQG